MDPFTERMLERARARREKLDQQLHSVGQPAGKKRVPLHETNHTAHDLLRTDDIMKNDTSHSPSKSILSKKESSVSPMKGLPSPQKQARTSPRKSSVSVKKYQAPSPPKKPDPVPETESDPEEDCEMEDTHEDENHDEEDEDQRMEEGEKVKGEVMASDQGSAMRNGVRSRLKRLGALYSDTEQLSSPIHRTENNFSAEPDEQPKTRLKSATRSARLAALASTINQWEDDLSHPSIATAAARSNLTSKLKNGPKVSSLGMKRKSIDKIHARRSSGGNARKCDAISKTPSKPQTPSVQTGRFGCSSTGTEKKQSLAEVTESPSKLVWDNTILASLESQGFTRSDSNSRLIYDFKQEKDASSDNGSSQNSSGDDDGDIEDEEENTYGSPKKGVSPSRSPLVMGVSQLRHKLSPSKKISSGNLRYSPFKPSPEKSHCLSSGSGSPANSPVKSQFRVNLKPVGSVDETPPKGTVLQRANNYENSTSSLKRLPNKDPAELSLSERMALFEKNKGPLLVPKVPFSTPMPAKLMKESEKATPHTSHSPQKSIASSCPPIKEPVLDVANVYSKSPQKSTSNPSANEGESAVLRRLRMFEAGQVTKDESPSHPQQQAVAERRREMEMLANRWNRNKEMATDESGTAVKTPVKSKVLLKENDGTPPPPPPMPGTSRSGSNNVSPRKAVVAASSPVRSGPTRVSPRRAAPKESYPGVSDVKRIKVSPPKTGHLYPSLSDMEATTEAETEEDLSSADHSMDDTESSVEPNSADNSFGRDILEAAEKVHSSYRASKDMQGENVSVTESAVLQDMDDFLDEALEESSEEYEKVEPFHSSAPQGSNKSEGLGGIRSSSSECKTESTPSMQRCSPRRASTKYRAPPPPVQSEVTPTHVVEGEQQVPLMHTVSFYRRQQNAGSRTPVRQVTRQPTSDTGSSDLQGSESSDSSKAEAERSQVELRVRQLLDDVSNQQTVISQASQALNLCNATVEFSGSAEQVEGERLLLQATHRRQAALNEIQRLKVEGTVRPQSQSGHDVSSFTDRGTLHISDITIPVKRDFVRSIAAEDNSHHFVCLAKCQDVVIATPVVSVANTKDLKGGQSVRFPSELVLQDLFSNFRVTLEVYTMTCRKEMLPHDIKYHINKKENSKHRMTPKKQKQDSHLLRPPVQSPAGPGAVRSPQFSLIGYVIFSLREIQRTQFTLNKVPYTSPLEGNIQLSLSCDLSLDIEQRGFLNMFDDVSGLGAWHRRWCLLKGEMLSYWKYPEDEKKKIALGSIDLRTCITEHVGVVPRDICARHHTFLLVTSRPANPNDEDSLILTRNGDTTHVKHLLSADTREERIEWCNQFNKALTVIRAWGKKTEV